jgi:signal transduction histidine kinase
MHAALFAVCGTALIALANWRSKQALPKLLVRSSVDGPGAAPPSPPSEDAPGWEELDLRTGLDFGVDTDAGLGPGLDRIGAFPAPTSTLGGNTVLYRQSWVDAAGSEYWRWSIVALVAMVAVSVAVGWWMAGRMLAPLGTMTARAQAMNAANLAGRFDTSGPADELADLAHTFNAMLARIQAAFASERQLVANVSHELRTPLATQRAVLELALTDDAGPAGGELAVASRIALDQNQRAAAIIDAMAVLARANRAGGGEDRVDEPVDLGTLVARVVADHGGAAEDAGVELTFERVDVADGLVVAGEVTLLERLVGNVVGNAIVHNVPGGMARVRVGPADGGGVGVNVGNTGPIIPEAALTDLVKPFRRGTAVRTGSHRGQGLGLAIIQAVADYHGAKVTIRPRGGGGLDVTVVFAGAPIDDQAP